MSDERRPPLDTYLRPCRRCGDKTYGNVDRCGYCGTPRHPDVADYPRSGIIAGVDWWVDPVADRWVVTVKGYGAGDGQTLAVLDGPPTDESLTDLFRERFGEEPDIDVWAPISTTEQPEGGSDE